MSDNSVIHKAEIGLALTPMVVGGWYAAKKYNLFGSVLGKGKTITPEIAMAAMKNIPQDSPEYLKVAKQLLSNRQAKMESNLQIAAQSHAEKLELFKAKHVAIQGMDTPENVLTKLVDKLGQGRNDPMENVANRLFKQVEEEYSGEARLVEKMKGQFLRAGTPQSKMEVLHEAMRVGVLEANAPINGIYMVSHKNFGAIDKAIAPYIRGNPGLLKGNATNIEDIKATLLNVHNYLSKNDPGELVTFHRTLENITKISARGTDLTATKDTFKIFSNSKINPIAELKKRGLSEEVLAPLQKAHAQGKLKLSIQSVSGKTGKALKSHQYLKIETEGGNPFRLHLPKKFGQGGRFYRDPLGRGFSLSGVVSDVVESNTALNIMGGDEFLLRKLGTRVEAGMYNLGKADVAAFNKLKEFQHLDYAQTMVRAKVDKVYKAVHEAQVVLAEDLNIYQPKNINALLHRLTSKGASLVRSSKRKFAIFTEKTKDGRLVDSRLLKTKINGKTVKEIMMTSPVLKDQPHFSRAHLRTNLNVVATEGANAVGHRAGGAFRGKILDPTFNMKIGVISAGEVSDMATMSANLQLIKREVGQVGGLGSYIRELNRVRNKYGKDERFQKAFEMLDESLLKKQGSAKETERALHQLFGGNNLEKIRALAEGNEGEGFIDFRWAKKNVKKIGVPGTFGQMDEIVDFAPHLKEFNKQASIVTREARKIYTKDTAAGRSINRLLESEHYLNRTYQDQVELLTRRMIDVHSNMITKDGLRLTREMTEALDKLEAIKRTGLVVTDRGQKAIKLRIGTTIGMQGGRAISLAREPGYTHYDMFYKGNGVMAEGIGSMEANKRWAVVMSGAEVDRYKRINTDIEGGLSNWENWLRSTGQTKRADEIKRLREAHIDALDIGTGTTSSHSQDVARQLEKNLTASAKPADLNTMEGRYWTSFYEAQNKINRYVGVQTGSQMPFTMEMGFELINGGDPSGELAGYFIRNLEGVNPEKAEFIQNLNKYVTGGKFGGNPLDALPTIDENYMGLEGTKTSQKIRNLTKGHTPELMGGYKYESKLRGTGENNILTLAEKAGIEKDSAVWRQLERSSGMETFYSPGTKTGIHQAVQEMNNSLRLEYNSGTTDRLLHVTDINRTMSNIAGAEEKIIKAKGNTTLLKSAISEYAEATGEYMSHPAMSMGGKFGLMRNLGRIKESTWASVQSSIAPNLEKGRIVVEAGYETMRKMGMTTAEIKAFEAAGHVPLEKAGFAVFGYRFPITGAHIMELRIAKDLAANQVKVSFGGDMMQLMDRDNDIQTLALLRIGQKDGQLSRETAMKYFEHQKAMIAEDEALSAKFSTFKFKQTMEEVAEGGYSNVLGDMLANARGLEGSKIVRDQFDQEFKKAMGDKSGWLYERAQGLEKMGVKNDKAVREALESEYLMGKLAGYTQKRIITSGTIPTATSAKRLTFALAELGGIGARPDQVKARVTLNKFGTILQQVPIWGQKHIKTGEEAVDFSLGVRSAMDDLSKGTTEGLEGFFHKLGSTKMYQKEMTGFFSSKAGEKLLPQGMEASQFAASKEGMAKYFDEMFEPVTTSLKTAFKESPGDAKKLIDVMKNMMARKPGLGGATLDDYAKAVTGLNFGFVKGVESGAAKGAMEGAEEAVKMFAGKAKKAFGAKGFALGALATMGALTVMGMAQSPNHSGPIIPPVYRRRSESTTPRADMNTINNGNVFNKMMNWFNPEQPTGATIRGQVNTSTGVNPEHVSSQINEANPGGRNNLSVQYRTDNLLSVRTKRRMKGEL